MRNFFRFCLPLVVLTACSAGTSGSDEHVTIESVVDAITFRTDDDQLVRMIGVRSPAAGSVVECYGKEALQAAESLIGKRVRLETEPLLERAQDGALPRYIWLPDPVAETEPMPEETGTGTTASGALQEEDESASSEAQEILVNEKALEMGTAFPLISKEMIYGERMLSAARYASATQSGLWGNCEVQSRTMPQGNWLFTQPVTECVIKGKVTNDGERIYRTPDCSAYGETSVLLSEGGQWFCAEDTAEDAGFVRADDCPEQ